MNNTERIAEIREQFISAKDVCETIDMRAQMQCFGISHDEYVELALSVEDIPYLLSELEQKIREITRLTIESVEREKQLAKLEAEVQRWAEAEEDGLLVVLSPYAKEGEPKPSCFYSDLVGAPWCLGLAAGNDDFPISQCQKCWYSEYSASEREEAEAALSAEGVSE